MIRLITVILLSVFFSVQGANAQKGKKHNHGKKSSKTVVHKEKKGKIHTHNTHRHRVKRTKVGHHHYRHMPRRGSMVAALPSGSLKFNHGGIGFHFHAGVWYKAKGPKWIIVQPPHGIRIKVLPPGHRRLVVGSNVYFYYYGSYYAQSKGEYEVVKAPLGAEVDSLPEGYDTVSIDDQEYYELDDTYYLPSHDDSGEEILVVVENPER